MSEHQAWQKSTALRHYARHVDDGVPPGRAAAMAAQYAGVSTAQVQAWVPGQTA